MWNDSSSEPVFEFLSHTAGINQVLGSTVNPSELFSQELCRGVTCRCSNDKTVKVFDVSRMAAVGNFTHHEWVRGRLLKRSAPVTHIAQSSGEFASLLATAGLDKYVYFVDVRVGEEARSDD